jgi:hypothetical protein
VKKLLSALGTDRTPVDVRVVPTSHRATEGNCYRNANEKVRRLGGRAQLRWAVWQHGNLFIEAEPHAVFDPGKGQSWIDPTPNSFPDGSRCRQILFIPNDATREPESTVVEDNIRVPLVDDPRLVEALKLASQRIALLNSIAKEWKADRLIFHYSPEQTQRQMQLAFRFAALLSAASRT